METFEEYRNRLGSKGEDVELIKKWAQLYGEWCFLRGKQYILEKWKPYHQ